MAWRAPFQRSRLPASDEFINKASMLMSLLIKLVCVWAAEEAQPAGEARELGTQDLAASLPGHLPATIMIAPEATAPPPPPRPPLPRPEAGPTGQGPARRAGPLRPPRHPIRSRGGGGRRGRVRTPEECLRNCEPQAAKEIANLLKSFPKSINTDCFVGWLVSKIKTKVRADAGMTIGMEEQVVLENLPRNATMITLYNILDLIDHNLDSREAVAQASRQQAEQFLLKEISTALEHTVFRNKILAVHLANTRLVEQGGHHRTVPIPYSDKEHALMQIFNEDTGVAAMMHDNDQQVRIRLAGDNHVELAFKQIIPREELEQKRAALLQDRETLALQVAARYQQERKIHRLEVHLKLTIMAGQEPIVRGWSSLDVETALIRAMGGSTIGIVGFLITTRNTHVDFEGRSPAHILVMDRGEQTDGETNVHKALADRLQKGTVLRDEKHFSAIRLKGTRGVVTTFIPPAGNRGQQCMRSSPKWKYCAGSNKLSPELTCMWLHKLSRYTSRMARSGENEYHYVGNKSKGIC
jgi:hypothetical protein